MMKRLYESLVREYLQYFPCVAILGARQCGKTTLLRVVCEGWEVFDLEQAADFDQIKRDPDFFLRNHPQAVAFDEAQLCPELFSALRVAIDQDRGQMGRFALTGSSSPALLTSISESLAGRIGIIELSPFQLAETRQNLEYSSFSQLLLNPQTSISILKSELKEQSNLQEIQTYWLKGGYPELWVKKGERFQKLWMNQYIQTYVMRDIARLFPRIDDHRFRLFIQTLASLSGKVINFSDVARALSVSAPTVRDYFHIAHNTFIWREIPAYEKNAVKRIIKHPKGYLRDSGLLCHLLHLFSQQDLQAHPQVGAIWEGVVIEEILRRLNSLGASFEYYYYRTSTGSEVDLVLEGEFGLIPIEIKMGQTVSRSSIQGLINFVADYNCRFGIVITNDIKIREIQDNILSIPFGFI
jgi:predicted AAA+ superfamily ATPase